jgi:hypothetical protein
MRPWRRPPSTGVNAVTGAGLADVLVEAAVVVDVTNSPSFEDAAVLEFFEKSSRNLLAAEAGAGVGHHVAVSIVGIDRNPHSGYMRAKVAQEKLIQSHSGRASGRHRYQRPLLWRHIGRGLHRCERQPAYWSDTPPGLA